MFYFAVIIKRLAVQRQSMFCSLSTAFFSDFCPLEFV